MIYIRCGFMVCLKFECFGEGDVYLYEEMYLVVKVDCFKFLKVC